MFIKSLFKKNNKNNVSKQETRIEALSEQEIKRESRSKQVSKSKVSQWRYIKPNVDFGVDSIAAEIMDSPKTLIVGQSGKERILDSLVKTIVSSFTPDEATILLLNDNDLDFRNYQRFPHVKAVTDFGDESLVGLDWLYHEANQRLKKMAERGLLDRWEGNQIYVLIDNYNQLFRTHKKGIQEALDRLVLKMRETGIHLIACAKDISDYHNISQFYIDTFCTRVATSISEYESKRLFRTDQYCGLKNGECAILLWNSTDVGVRICDLPISSDVELQWLLKYWTTDICKQLISD